MQRWAKGGSLDVSSKGPNVIAFRITPGTVSETVYVRTPEQCARARHRARMLWWLGIVSWLAALAWAVLQ